jgi:predicted HicB family RNase H-like nuclease
MDEELHKELKIAAAVKGITVQEFVSGAIERTAKKDNRLIARLLK